MAATFGRNPFSGVSVGMSTIADEARDAVDARGSAPDVLREAAVEVLVDRVEARTGIVETSIDSEIIIHYIRRQ